MSSWRHVPLGEVITFQSGGTPSKSNPDYWSGDVPWLSAKDMKRFRIDDTEDHLSEAGAQSGTRIVPAKTVFMLVRGMTLLSDVPIVVAQRPMAFNQDVKALRPTNGLLEEFLPYLVLGLKPRLLNMVDLAGHGTGRLNSVELASLPVDIPPVEVQRAIAHILGTLDDKIELNRQMNRTMDEIARTLFTSWFVNFDPVRAKVEGRQPEGMDAETAALFPDRFVDSELGPIPEGWEVRALGDIADFKRSTVKPFDHPDKSFAHYSLPAFDFGQTPDLTLGVHIKSAKTQVAENAVLLSKLNPHIPRVWMPSVCAEQEATPVASTEFFVLIAKERVPRSFLMALVSSSVFQRQFATLASGTSNSHQRVRPGDAKQIAQVMPGAPVLAAFDERVEPLYQLMLANRDESITLDKLRDTLLPKMISGELTLPVTRQEGLS